MAVDQHYVYVINNRSKQVFFPFPDHYSIQHSEKNCCHWQSLNIWSELSLSIINCHWQLLFCLHTLSLTMAFTWKCHKSLNINYEVHIWIRIETSQINCFLPVMKCQRHILKWKKKIIVKILVLSWNIFKTIINMYV